MKTMLFLAALSAALVATPFVSAFVPAGTGAPSVTRDCCGCCESGSCRCQGECTCACCAGECRPACCTK